MKKLATSVFCATHAGEQLVDVRQADGIGQACKACVPLELVDVVRQLWAPKTADGARA